MPHDNPSSSQQLDDLVADQVFFETLSTELASLTQKFASEVSALKSRLLQATPDQKKYIQNQISQLISEFNKQIDYIQKLAI